MLVGAAVRSSLCSCTKCPLLVMRKGAVQPPFPPTEDPAMLASFEDFCTWMYVVVDDLWKEVAPLFHRPGPAPRCADAELLAMALIGECRGWDVETELLAHFRDYRHL